MRLASDAARPREAAMDFENDPCLARPEASVHVAVRLVEHERGLELQVNCPEFTLATMLPTVNASEAATVLNIEDFSDIFDANPSEAARIFPMPFD